MNRDEMFPSKYFNGENVGIDGVTVTIDRVESEEVGEAKEVMQVLHFSDNDKMVTLNKTRGNQVFDLCGDNSDNWEGKTIRLVAGTTKYKGKTLKCVDIVENDAIPV